MSSAHQAVYDATVNSLRNCDVGAAVREAVSVQIQSLSFAIEHIKDEYLRAAYGQQLPHVLMRPTLSMDGNMWCALYGDNLKDGVAGFGVSPSEAMTDFDKHWVAPIISTTGAAK